MKAIMISLFVFFSFPSFAQQGIKEKADTIQKTDSLTIAVLSAVDMQAITKALQYMPAKDWLKVCGIIEQVYQWKLKEMRKEKQVKTTSK